MHTITIESEAGFFWTSLWHDWAFEFQNLEFLKKKSLRFFMQNVLSFEFFKKNTEFSLNLLLKMRKMGYYAKHALCMHVRGELCPFFSSLQDRACFCFEGASFPV